MTRDPRIMTPGPRPRPGRTIVEAREERRGTEQIQISITWHVEELEGEAAGPAGDGRCLVFTSHEVMRRVVDFPVNWMTLSDRELLAISWRR